MVTTVAVVEDSAAEAEMLRQYFLRYQEEHGEILQVSWFTSGEDFLERYRPIYHVIFMDIGLPGLNGMETAKRLRERDKVVTLVFATNMAQFAVRGYEMEAFDYLVKPIGYPNFALKLQRVLGSLRNRQESEVVLNLPNRFLRLSTSQIRYIEVSGHNLIYHANSGPIYAYGNLKDVEAKLNRQIFVRCNSCYLVNLNYVRAIQGYVAVVGNDELQISRPKRKAFIQALNDYLGGGI